MVGPTDRGRKKGEHALEGLSRNQVNRIGAAGGTRGVSSVTSPPYIEFEL